MGSCSPMSSLSVRVMLAFIPFFLCPVANALVTGSITNGCGVKGRCEMGRNIPNWWTAIKSRREGKRNASRRQPPRSDLDLHIIQAYYLWMRHMVMGAVLCINGRVSPIGGYEQVSINRTTEQPPLLRNGHKTCNHWMVWYCAYRSLSMQCQSISNCGFGVPGNLKADYYCK